MFLPSIAPIARRQHGLISIAQLAELGVGTRQRETLVRHGVLVPEVPRVYSMVGAPRSVAAIRPPDFSASVRPRC
ncbi:MAG: type IV toxin-antitoxin system AbiEi family antitoxin domain-containing protein [Ilumatobacteraceae bacterium]